MKTILPLWLCQTLLILVLKYITICNAVDPSELSNLARRYYDKSNSNDRRGYGGPDNVNRANQYYETAYADGVRRTSQQHQVNRAGSETKFTKPEHLRKLSYPDMRDAYNTARGYINTRNGASSETDFAAAGSGSTEKDDTDVSVIQKIGVANNTAFSVATSSSFKSNSNAKSSTDTCACEGSGANEEVSFICFSSKDGSNNFSIKYKGTTMFNLEDIIKAYTFYFDQIKINILNGENHFKQVFEGQKMFNFNHTIFNEGLFNFNAQNNFKHDFEAEKKFNFDLSNTKNTFNEGNFNFDTESKFDLNEMKKNSNKFKVNTFDKFDMNTNIENSNKFNNDNNKFKTEFEKKFNSNFNLESNSKMEAWKKTQDMAESNKNSKFSFDSGFNSNQVSFDSGVHADAQAEIEAYAKALAQAKALVKAKTLLQIQAQAQAQAQAEANAQAIIQNQILAQAQAEAQAQAMAQAQVQADSQFNVQGQSQVQAQAQAQAQAHAQTFGQGLVNSKSQAHAFSFSDANNNGRPNNGFLLGAGGKKKIFGNGFSLGFKGGFGASYGSQAAGAYGLGGSGSGSIGLGGRAPLAGQSALGRNEGLGIGAAMAYSGGEANYADAAYDENPDDEYLSTGYPGVIAFPAANDSPITGNKFFNDGHKQKSAISGSFGGSGGFGYQRYQ